MDDELDTTGVVLEDTGEEGDCFEADAPPPGPVTRGGAPAARQFPKSPAVVPKWALAFGNGKLPEDRLQQVADLPRTWGHLVPEAAVAWAAFQDAAREQGFTLTMTGAYRPFEDQVNLFTQRYSREPLDGGTGRSKLWGTDRYYLKPGFADAATPGRSNHGWGTAVDMALGGYGRSARNVTSDERFMQWAVANARSHGWSWETWEPWHVRLVELPKRVPQRTDVVTETSKDESPKDESSKDGSAEAAPDPVLGLDMTGDAVAALQRILIRHGWADFTLADGRFGPRTEAAVRTMQAALGRHVDGEYGPRTAAALRAFLAAPPASPPAGTTRGSR